MDRLRRDRYHQQIFLDLGYDDALPKDGVLERIRRGEWYFCRLDLTGGHLSGLNCAVTDFSYCHAPRSNWASSYVARARFCGANLAGSDLRGVYWRGGDLRALNLQGADLRGADLSQTDVRGADFRGADIAGVGWHQSRGDRFTQLPAGLTFADLGIQSTQPDAQWAGLTLSRADLRDLDLRHANFTQAIALRTDLRGTNLRHANLSDAEVTGCIYNDDTQFPQGFDPQAADCVWLGNGADLSFTDLSHLDLGGIRLQGANISGADLRRSLLTHTNLLDANLTRANLSHAVALGCDLTRANLDQAMLDGIDLRTARLPSGKRYGAGRSPFDCQALANALTIHDPNLRRG
ncbi:MAG: pentapeptide repeat-containing protein [Cyanophyceae cyanobacterium]